MEIHVPKYYEKLGKQKNKHVPKKADLNCILYFEYFWFLLFFVLKSLFDIFLLLFLGFKCVCVLGSRWDRCS